MIILDTNVLSALMTDPADRPVIAWLDRQARISMWTTSITVLEICFGLADDGRRPPPEIPPVGFSTPD